MTDWKRVDYLEAMKAEILIDPHIDRETKSKIIKCLDTQIQGELEVERRCRVIRHIDRNTIALEPPLEFENWD